MEVAPEPGQARLQAGQRQTAEIDPAQISTAQVEPHASALAPLFPIDRSDSALVRRQEPLNIRATQGDIFEGAGKWFTSWTSGQMGCQNPLALEVDFRLASPGLPPFSPIALPGFSVIGSGP